MALNNKQSVESLRSVLTIKQNKTVTYDEAQEVGESLIAFFEALASRDGSEL